MDIPQNPTAEDELKRWELESKKADLKNKRLELLFKLAGLLTITFGIVWPLYQYTKTLEKDREDRKERQVREDDQKKKETDAALREARKPFLQRQQELYFEAATLASKLSTLDPGAEREMARKRFYQLYWGELSVVEDVMVEKAMVRFKGEFENYERERANNSQVSRQELEQRSLKLAHAFRDSLAISWGYDRGSNDKTTYASGTFEVKLPPQEDKSVDATLGRMTIDKQFHGDLEAVSKGQMLTAGTAVNGSAGYVAIERVSGKLHGLVGSFTLQHSATMTRGEPQLTIIVVPDSGTEQLEGLAGKMAIKIADGKHSYDFEYTLAKTR